MYMLCENDHFYDYFEKDLLLLLLHTKCYIPYYTMFIKKYFLFNKNGFIDLMKRFLKLTRTFK